MRLDDWALVDDTIDSSPAKRTLFAVANGFLGFRGVVEEDDDIADQTYANGFYDTWPIIYPETAYGMARDGQTTQPLINPCGFRLVVDGAAFEPGRSEVSGYERRLDFRSGQLTRHLTWLTPTGVEIRIDSTRLVSLDEPGLALMTYSVRASGDCDLQLSHALVFPQAGAAGPDDDPRRATRLEPPTVIAAATSPTLAATVRTGRSALTMSCVAAHHVVSDAATTQQVSSTSDRVSKTVTSRLSQGQSLAMSVLVGVDPVMENARRIVDRPVQSWPAVATAQRRRLDAWWRAADVTVETGGTPAGTRRDATVGAIADATVPTPGDGPIGTHSDATVGAPAGATVDAAGGSEGFGDGTAGTVGDMAVCSPGDIQGRIRWNLFQVVQASACAGGRGIPAKGVTGPGYDGHYFWDCESMILPCLIYTMPELARDALSFRHATLPRARERARELRLGGACYPWRTIDGREASAYFEAGTAQFHINADIAYAIRRYLRATGDEAYLREEAVEILVETARLWMNLGFSGDDGRFHIHQVTGPDEYSALVDDNVYTNVMAATNLEAADQALDDLASSSEVAWSRLVDRLGVTTEERRRWRQAAATVAIPFDDRLGIHAQDADFLSHQVWDFANTPATMYPLLLHYHPLTIYRHQVLKQADTVLALINRPDRFTAAEKLADFDYYDRLTTGDSTLSASSQAIMAAEVGHGDLAWRHFLTAVNVDLDDSHANAADGVHVASTGAIWSCLVMGFAGLRDFDGISLDPHLPQGWTGLAFALRLREATVRVRITPAELEAQVEAPGPHDQIELTIRGQIIRLNPANPAARVPLN
ncbi:MAG: glycoside hydrolase family 65 protein [Propionibacteriaceae bacterium]|nr:glycoside hydrolase family 65 protein [Propionibacteriaceae bacterium]